MPPAPKMVALHPRSPRVLTPLLVGVFIGVLTSHMGTLFLRKTPSCPSLRSHGAAPDESWKMSRFAIEPYPIWHVCEGPVAGPFLWKELPQFVRKDFTLGGQIPYVPFLRMEEASVRPEWNNSHIEFQVKLADSRNPNTTLLSGYGPSANDAFFQALGAHPVSRLSVLVVGSQTPWVEAICISFGAGKITTVDFNPPIARHPRLNIMSLAELDRTRETFDALFSFSSIEHDGLGRYGDPINPWGDLRRMQKLKGLLKPGGKLYLGVPNGPDSMQFNAHRIYGPIRFPMLIKGWNLLATFGTSLEECWRQDGYECQPIHVLTVESSD